MAFLLSSAALGKDVIIYFTWLIHSVWDDHTTKFVHCVKAVHYSTFSEEICKSSLKIRCLLAFSSGVNTNFRAVVSLASILSNDINSAE